MSTEACEVVLVIVIALAALGALGLAFAVGCAVGEAMSKWFRRY